MSMPSSLHHFLIVCVPSKRTVLILCLLSSFNSNRLKMTLNYDARVAPKEYTNVRNVVGYAREGKQCAPPPAPASSRFTLILPPFLLSLPS